MASGSELLTSSAPGTRLMLSLARHRKWRMMNQLTSWQNFYVIVGSAAGALTGLQFIAMALIADMSVKPGEVQSGEAFATPAVVHFVAVLLLAASMVMPWPSLRAAALAWGAAGLSGVGYTLLIARRMRQQTGYQPVLEDWFFRAVVPCCAYTGMTIAAAFVPAHAGKALFAMAGAMVVLLVVAIHNAWDNVTYLVFTKRREAQQRAE